MSSFLIIRDEDKAKPIAQSLVKNGDIVIVTPILQIEEITVDLNSLRDCNNFNAAIVTSQNACHTTLQILNYLKVSKDVIIYATGKQTAEPFIDHGYRNVIIPKIESAESLSQLILAQQKNLHILYCRALEVSFDFNLTLQNQHLLHEIICYKTSMHHDFIDNLTKKLATLELSNIDYIVVYSKKSVAMFLSATQNLRNRYFSNSKLVCTNNNLKKNIQELARQAGFGEVITINSIK